MEPSQAKQLKAEILTVLRGRMREAGVTMAEIERRLGKNKNWLGNRMSGLVRMGLEELLAILIEIGEDPGGFFADVLPPPKKEKRAAKALLALEAELKRRSREGGE